MIRPGCVESLVALAEKTPGGIVVPWLWEKNDRHYDSSADVIVPQPGGSLRIEKEKGPAIRLGAQPVPVQFFEHHCCLITRAAQDKLGVCDEELNTREAVDVSVAAWRHGIPVLLDRLAQVDFHAPPPVERAERAFYDFRWDSKRADESHVRVSRRWNIVDIPDSYDFVREQKLRKSHLTWAWIRARSLLRKFRDRLTVR
jgi:hypothetical protein